MGDIKNSKEFNFENLYHNNILPNGKIGITEEFLNKITELIFKNIVKSNNRHEKVLDFMHPEKMVESLSSFDIGKEPLTLDKIIDDCAFVMDNSVRTAHPRCFNQLFQGLDLVSLAGEFVTAATNTNMYSYEMAPAFNVIETITIKKMASLCGWSDSCEGIFAPGGSISNLYGLQCAMHYYYPQIKTDGMYNLPKLIVFTSAHSHYSIQRAVAILGLGLNNIRTVPVDEKGKLKPEELEKMIEACKQVDEVPFFVSCTSGTTVLGAYDPIDLVAKICQKHKMWLHIDAAWGGSALLSKKHKHLLKGIESADSVTWNPHKLMGALLQCSVFLIKKKGILSSCNGMNASYLFQKDKFYDVSFDTGDKTIQCGRHVDAFKCWLMWRSKGDKGFENQINRLFDLATLLCQEIENRENFELVLKDPECTNVCFWYIPNSLKNLDRNSDEYKQKLNKVAPKIKEAMMLNGSMMIGYQPLDEKPNFFRMVFANQGTREEDVYFLLDEIEKLGKSL